MFWNPFLILFPPSSQKHCSSFWMFWNPFPILFSLPQLKNAVVFYVFRNPFPTLSPHPQLSGQSSDLAIRVLHLPITASAVTWRGNGKTTHIQDENWVHLLVLDNTAEQAWQHG
jgi:hypothetical protein